MTNTGMIWVAVGIQRKKIALSSLSLAPEDLSEKVTLAGISMEEIE